MPALRRKRDAKFQDKQQKRLDHLRTQSQWDTFLDDFLCTFYSDIGVPTTTLLRKVRDDLRSCVFQKSEVERYLYPLLVVLLRDEPHKMEALRLVSECTDCGQYFSSQYNLNKHQRQWAGLCSSVDRFTKCKGALPTYDRSSFLCIICGTLFATKMKTLVHIKDSHDPSLYYRFGLHQVMTNVLPTPDADDRDP